MKARIKIPNGWKSFKIKDVAQVNPRSNFVNHNSLVTFLSMSAVSELGIIQNPEVRKAIDVKKGFTSFETGDVLVAKITPCFENYKGCLCTEIKNNRGYGSTEFHVLRPKKNITGEYLHILTRTHHFRKTGELNMTGTAGQKRVPTIFLKNYKIPLPPLPEQKAIADLLSTWDEAIEKTERLIQAKEMHFKWLLQELISKPQKNKKWEKVKLGDICKIASKEKLISVKGHFLLTVKSHCLGIERNDRIVPKLTKRGRPYFQHKSGDFLIGRQNFHNGGFGIIPSELNGGITSNAISCLIVNESKLLKEFLFFQFSNPNYYRKTENIMDGTVQKELSDKQILKLNICLPKIEEQKQIAETLSTAQHEINLLKQLVEKYKIQKRGLMQKMLTGTWRIKPEIINQYKEE